MGPGPHPRGRGAADPGPGGRAARPYQLHAAIAACHSVPDESDWPQIAALYGELARYEPTPVTEANRAVAVAMAGQPAAGLGLLDALGTRLARWPQFHIARAELLPAAGAARRGRQRVPGGPAAGAGGPGAVRIERRLAELLPSSAAWRSCYRP